MTTVSKFARATRHKVFLKLAITGPAGSVKTVSALLLAIGLANGGKVALLDSENKSASVYSGRFKFDVLDVSPPFTEQKFIEAIEAAVSEGYQVFIIDSFSHAWLEILDFKAALDARGGNSYTNWSKAGAKFNKLMATILQSQIHLICCMRSKMDYVLEQDIRGKLVPRKVGLAPVMRDGIEYDFSTIFEGDLDHYVSVSKDRTGLFVDQRFQITEETGRQLLEWLNSVPEAVEAAVGAPEPKPENTPAPPTPVQPPSPTSVDGQDGSAKPAPALSTSAQSLSAQERLQEALFGLHEDWITGFLIDRKKISTGQTIIDAPADYCETALKRITSFRNAVIDFGEVHDAIVVGD
jgi:hypothetical protein